MPRPRHLCSVLVLFLLTLASGVARGADTLEEIPADALGFVLLHNVGTVDAKVGQLASMLGRDLPQPLAFLKDVTGISDGLDPHGDFLLVLVPTGDENANQPRYCVWLPVADYDQLVNSVGGTPSEGISAVTIAGEDLLVARRGDWALVMDPDERQRMTQMLTAPQEPPAQARDWKPWIAKNDVTVVAFAAGIRQTAAWLTESGAEAKPAGDSEDDLFGSSAAPDGQDALAASRRNSPRGLLAEIRSEFQKWNEASPELAQAVEKAGAFGCGMRLDNDGNILAGMHVAWNGQLTGQEPNGKSASDLPPALYEGGGFVLHGAGQISQPAIVGIASAYVRRLAADLETEEHTQLDVSIVNRLQEAVATAAGDIRSALVLNQPGGTPGPVYVNDFAAVRVSNAGQFVAHANEVMRLWNQANRDANGETKLVFDVEETKVGSRTGTQYSIDFAEMAGMPVLPETRQAMEKLFGPGGKLRMWIVPVDDTTVLLALGTPDQVTSALKILDHKRPIDWAGREISESNQLLPSKADWRLFFDPHHYHEWLRRQSDAIVGAPVIGGPLVKNFPASPPVGVAGGAGDREFWVELAAPAPTIKSAGSFFKK